MTEQWVTILAAIIGGFIAGATGWFVSWRNDCRTFKHKAGLFTRAIKDDLNKSKLLYKKVIEAWEKNNTVWLDTLGEIEASRDIYNKCREWTLVYPENLRNRISDYYYKSAIGIYFLRDLQNRKTEIELMAGKLFFDLKAKDLNVPNEQINKQVVNAISSYQHTEYGWINATIPKKVDYFKELAQDIENILLELDKVEVKI